MLFLEDFSHHLKHPHARKPHPILSGLMLHYIICEQPLWWISRFATFCGIFLWQNSLEKLKFDPIYLLLEYAFYIGEERGPSLLKKLFVSALGLSLLYIQRQ
jgi:hypothetical protein